jgi:hypothetical protein
MDASRLPQGAQGAMRAKGGHTLSKNNPNEAITMPTGKTPAFNVNVIKAL